MTEYGKVAGDPAQVQPVYIQLEGFLAHFRGVCPRFRIGCVLFHAEHANITLAASGCFSHSILSFGSLALWTLDHAFILPIF